MKILIAGAGKVGASLTRALSADGQDITLIDSSCDALNKVQEQYDVLSLEGNCATMQTLSDGGVKNADLLIAVTNSDEINMLSCAVGRKLNPSLHTIARIRDPEYADQVYDMKDIFGLSMTINPEKAAAQEIHRLLKYPGFLKRDSFARGRVEIVELRVEKNSPLCGRPLCKVSEIVQRPVLVCTALRDGKVMLPKGDFVPQEGDRLFVTASSRDLTQLLRDLEILPRKNKRVMLCGGGVTSIYLAQLLERDGIDVQIIEKNEEKCLELAQTLPDCAIIHGDITDTETLEKEGLSSCDALVTLTGIDEMNVLISLSAKNRGVPQVITKLGHSDFLTDMVQELAIGSLILPKEICSHSILRYVRSMRDQKGDTALTVQAIADGHVEACEFIVNADSLNRGRSLMELADSIRKDVLIVAISRGRNITIASGHSYFEEGDSVIVISGGEPVRRFNDIFE